MKYKLSALLLTVATLLSSVLVVNIATAPPPPTTVYLSPDPAVAGGPGESVIVSIMISGVPVETPIYALGVKMTWHPPLLQAVSVSEGDFLMMGGNTYFTPIVDNSDLYSYADIGITLVGAVPGVSGGGMIAQIEFLVEGTGECTLDVTSTLLTPNPTPPPIFNEVAHTDEDGTFYTTMSYWEANLVRKSAWPQYHHFDMSARSPTTINTLYAKARNLGMMDVMVKAVFRIRDVSGMDIILETDPYLLTTVEEFYDFTMPFDTATYGPSKYYVEAKVKYDTNGDGYIDTWGAKIKTFSFSVVP